MADTAKTDIVDGHSRDVAGATLRGKMLKGFAWETTAKLTIQILSWVSTIVVARLLDPSDYGLAAIAMLFTQFFDMLVDMGLPQSLIHKVNTTRDEEDGVFYFSLALGVVLYAVMFMIAPTIASLYGIPELADVMRVVGISAIFVGLKVVPFAKLSQRMDFRYRSTVEIVANFWAVITALSLAYMGYGVWTLIVTNLVMHAVTTLAYLRRLDHVPRPRFNPAKVWNIFEYGLRIFGSNLMYFFYSRAPTFVAGKFVSTALVGQYNLASSLASIPMDKIGVIFNRVGLATFARLKEDHAEVRRYFLTMHRYLLIISFPVLLGLATVADDVVSILLTDKWGMAGTLLQILCIGSMFKVSAMIPQYGLLLGIGRASLVMRYHLASLILIPLGAVVGIQFGIVTMTWALVLAFVPLYLMLMNYALREIGASFLDLLKSASPAFLGSMAMATVVLLIKMEMANVGPFLRLGVCATAGAITYVGFVALVYRGHVNEIRDGLSMLRSKDPKSKREKRQDILSQAAGGTQSQSTSDQETRTSQVTT